MSRPVESARDIFSTYAAIDAPDTPADVWSKLQVDLCRWERHNFEHQPIYRNVLGVCEEAGELAHAVLKHEQAIRGCADYDAFREEAGDAILDIVVYAMNACTKLRLDFGILVRTGAAEVMKRDWVKFPENGIDK